MANFEYRMATDEELEKIWNEKILRNPGSERWADWRTEYINYNANNHSANTFVIIADNQPVGEGTLLLSPDCSSIGGRLNLANNKDIGNINALRVSKEFEGMGHMSKLIQHMEAYAREKGIKELTIGVEAKETRNIGIYLHWGYNVFVTSEIEDGELVLYYKKDIAQCA